MAKHRTKWVLVAAWLATCLVPAPTFAKDAWTAEDGKSSLEVGAFYKTFSSGLRMQSGLVDATEALEALAAAARDGLPPEQAALVPEVKAVPPYGGTSAHTARIWGRLMLWERLELSAAWQLGTIIASDPAFIGGAALGSAVPVTATQGASRRLVDFDPVLAEKGGFMLQHNLDLLALKLRTPFADITAGRQVLSWGSGRFWNPTDLLSPFGPTDIDREVRRGIDAVRVSIPLAETTQLELLWLPQLEPRDHGGVLRTQFNLGGFDIASSVAKYVRDAVFGLESTGDIGPVGVHGELAATVGLDHMPQAEPDRFLRAVVGADVRPLDDLVLTGEYYFNGWGATDPSGYLGVLRSARVTRGEVFGAGRHYLGLAAAWQASELLSVQATAITNLQDPSVLIVPALEYWAEQSVLLRVGGYVPLGRQPDAAALESLTLSDLTSQSDAWRSATGTLGLRSEYGASPFGIFVQLAVHLL
jgi:hypothetical protein